MDNENKPEEKDKPAPDQSGSIESKDALVQKAVSQQPPANQSQNTPKNQDNLTRFEKFAIAAGLIIAGLNVFILIFQSVMMRGQLDAMKIQLDEMRRTSAQIDKQIKVAIESNELARQQLIATEAAVLEPRVDFSIEGRNLRFTLSNYGQTMASKIGVRLQILKETLPDRKPASNPAPFECDFPYIKPLEPGEVERRLCESPLSITEKELLLIKETKLTVLVDGTITYFNGFDTVKMPLCFAHIQNAEIGNNLDVPCKQIDIYVANIQERLKE